MANVTQWLTLSYTTSKQRSRSFILVPMISHIYDSQAVNGNFCSSTHRLATIHSVQTDDRRTQHYSISATVSTVS